MSKFSRSARCGSNRRNAMQPRNSLLVALFLMCAASTLHPSLAMAAETIGDVLAEPPKLRKRAARRA